MKYVTYIALMFGAAHAKQFVIDINEDEIKREMQIEQQGWDNLGRDADFSNAAN